MVDADLGQKRNRVHTKLVENRQNLCGPSDP